MDLQFSPPVKVDTERGVQYHQRAQPTELFWREWRFNQENLAAAGVFVERDGQNYIVHRILQQDFHSKLVPARVKPFPLRKTKKYLLEFQPPLVERLCSSVIANNIGIDGSDAGIGKTYHALAVCKELSMQPAIVCTKIGITDWKNVCSMFGVIPLFIVNWEAIIPRAYVQGRNRRVWKCSFPYVEAKRSPYTGQITFEWSVPTRKNIIFIFDECHKGNGVNSRMGEMFARAGKYPILALSATIAEKPENLRNLGFLCKLFKYEDFNSWLRKMGCYKKQRGNGWESPCASQDMNVIGKLLFPRFGGRLRKMDIPGFPDIQNIASAYPIRKVKEHNRAYNVLLRELSEIDNEMDDTRREKEILKHSGAPTEKERLKDLSKKLIKAQAEKMVLNLRYRQFTEFLKVPLFVDLVQEEISRGNSVALFLNFTDTLRELAKKLKTNCIVTGSQSGTKKGMDDRRRSIQSFQSDSSRVIVCNIAAGGISINLHDCHGDYPRVSIISPTYSAKQLIQVLGRIHRSGAKSKAINRLIYAAGTVEEAVCDCVSSKVDAINALNDADLAETDIFNLLKG